LAVGLILGFRVWGLIGKMMNGLGVEKKISLVTEEDSGPLIDPL
jgi:hypothetical protein